MAQNYNLIKPREMTGIVNILIAKQEFTLEMSEEDVTVREGRSPRQLMDIVMEQDTFAKIKDGSWTAMTAAGRDNMGQTAPLDFIPGPGQKIGSGLMQLVYHLGTHFFAIDYPQVMRFGPGHTRYVHGGHAAALAYGYGVRFAYYTITDVEQINSEEDRNPFYQLICVIGGRGTARIAGKDIPLEKGIAVSVPINETHTFRAASGQRLEFFILMYGPGA